MQSLALIAMIGLGQPGAAVLPPELRVVRSLPCGPRFQPMAVRLDTVKPRGLTRTAPAPRRDPVRPRAQPCYRLASA